jgi:hypothetical protein
MTWEGLGGIEADPIVLDLQGYVGRPRGEPQAHRDGSGMLDRVVERLLGDPVQRLLRLEWNVRLLAEIGVNGDPVAGLEAAACLPRAATSPSDSSDSGRSSKMSARISARPACARERT